MLTHPMLAEHERIRATSFHPHGTFVALPNDELDQSLLPRFAQMVEKFPDQLAVQVGARALTYRQLDEAANRVAHALLAASGAEPCAIALLFGMEIEWIVATLAVWKAGKFWVALDLRHPQARLTAVLDDAQTPLILTSARHKELAALLADTERQWLDVDELLTNSHADESQVLLPTIEVKPESYAYLVYTSGSTGRPKGVIENHTNILHMIAERGGLVHPSNADCIALLLPPAAGGAIYNIVLALWYGAALKLFEFAEEGVSRFEDWLLIEGITGMHAGVVLRTWLPTLDGRRHFPTLRFLLLGAAPVYREHVVAFQRYLGGACVLVNPYSSAEVRAASLFAMNAETVLSSQIIPVGYPPDWVTFEIWDEENKSLPAGTTGEVIIFSQYMTPGYWRQPELSAAVFGVDDQGRRYYRSGDVGRLDGDGCLWILGRKDRQVKIRGYRVEPAEVEVELLSVDGVREAAVVAEGARDDENFLAAYVTLLPGSDLGVAEVQQRIAARLPNYMVPRQVTVLEKMPRNGYGKVDRPHLRAYAAAQRVERQAKVSMMTTMNATPNLLQNPSTGALMQLPAESLVVDGEIYAHHVKLDRQYFHPTGEHIPITSAEIELTLLHRWVRMVERFGDNAALEEGDRVVSYRDFNTLANRIAHAILARKAARDLPLAVLFDIESDLHISIFGVWKAGNFFLWVEPQQPLARNQYIVEDSGAPLVVTNRKYAELAHQLWPGADQVLVIEELAEDLLTGDPPLTIGGLDTTYLMYTSGSTGKPKGTVELHRNLVAMMAVRQEVFHFSDQDRISNLGLASGWSYSACAALMYGGCLFPFRMKEEGLAKFSQYLLDKRITASIGGSVMRTWLLSLDGSQQFPHLRAVSVGAGPSYVEHLHAFQQHLGDHAVLMNTYSATECRSAAMFILDKHTQLTTRLIPGGFPTLRGAIEIWDDNDQPLPVGETGEIIALTPFNAAGYWRSPELTAARFGTDAQGRRYYRMGDLGRLDAQNCLWVLGRKDSQVKIRGFRVETAEVEVALLELPHVQEVAVIAMGDSDEARYLMAFVASRELLRGDELRAQLATRLPNYMVPATILVLEELPHNANGKVARPLLREMAVAFTKSAREASRQLETTARTETESRVIGLMQELLTSNRGDVSHAADSDATIGLHDNFFDVGGHSLLAARLMLQIHRSFGVDLSPRDFITAPTAAALARAIDQTLAAQHSQAQAVQAQRPLRIEAMQMVNGSDDHAPIFLCLGGNGSQVVLLRYQKLIRRLGKEWHLYGLVTTEDDDPSGLYGDMDALVGEAMAALRRVRPRGPYLLMGECLGGKLAFELARALEAEGERTLLLTLLDAGLKRITVNNFDPKTWHARFAYHRAKVAGLSVAEGARYLWDRFVARLPSSMYPYATEHRGHIAQKRYFELLHDYEPNQRYAHPAVGVYTRDNEPHLASWQEVLPHFEVTMVEGTHQEYMYLSGDTVVATLREALTRAERASQGTLTSPQP